MKKTIYIIILICLIIPNYTYATGACLIKNKSAEVLLDYIKENRKVVKNITKAIVEYKNEKDSNKKEEGFIDGIVSSVKNSYDKFENETLSVFNEIFHFSGYFSYFKYYVTFPISNEVPYEVERDYKILENEYKGLINYIKKIDKGLSTKIIVENPCEGVEKKCEFKNIQSKDIVGKLMKNSDDILDLYRLTVIGDSENFEGEGLFLVGNNFELEIERNYGPDAVSACNSSEGGFFDRVTKAIEEIKLLNELGEKGIQEWKDAFGLLIGKKPSVEKILEKELLRKYLSEIGVSLENQNITLDNLERYNQEGFSMNNNFISNTLTSAFSKISTELSEWKDAVVSDFFGEDKDVVIEDITRVTENSDISISIKENISKLYNAELPYSAVGDETTEQLRAKIIETHMSLDDSINTLEATIEVSRKVCNSQNQGAGICE